jgi:hypothetical protein
MHRALLADLSDVRERAAKSFPPAGTVEELASPTLNTLRSTMRAMTTPSAISASLIGNAGFLIFAGASMANRMVPETALIQNPIQMSGMSRFIGASGRVLPTPSSRRSITATSPTRTDIPRVCRNKIVG